MAMCSMDTTQLQPISQLPLIPPEVWSEIFIITRDLEGGDGFVTPHAFRMFIPDGETIFSLRNVSLACKAFYRVALPLRFERLAIQYEEDGAISPALLAQLQHLAAHPEMRPWVRAVGIQRSPKDFLRPPPRSLIHYGTIPKIIEDVLLGMENLMELMLQFITITPRAYTHIFSLRRLRRLSLYRVKFEENIDSTRKNTALQNSSFVLSPGRYSIPPVGDLHQPLAPPRFAPQLQEINLRHLTDLLGLISFITRHKFTPRNLHTLKVFAPRSIEQFGALYDFLRETPSLHRLELFESLSCPPSLPLVDAISPAKDIIPFLQEYQGPIDIADLIVPGRPVNTLVFPRENNVHIWFTLGRLQSVSPGTVPVLRLRADWLRAEKNKTRLWALGRKFPDLEELQLYWREWKAEEFMVWARNSSAKDLKSFRRLRSLSIRAQGTRCPLSEDLTVMQALDAGHPLQSFILPSGRQLIKENGSWTMAVPKPDAE